MLFGGWLRIEAGEFAAYAWERGTIAISKLANAAFKSRGIINCKQTTKKTTVGGEDFVINSLINM